jgi:hypothetical protein
MVIKVSSQGSEIIETNYWGSPYDKTGLILCSINKGTIRVLIPDLKRGYLADMATAQYCILSRGRWPEAGEEGIEILWEDHSTSPFILF